MSFFYLKLPQAFGTLQTLLILSTLSTCKAGRAASQSLELSKASKVCVAYWKRFLHPPFLVFCRLRQLLNEMAQEKANKTIIFIETKRKVEDVTRGLRSTG